MSLRSALASARWSRNYKAPETRPRVVFSAAVERSSRLAFYRRSLDGQYRYVRVLGPTRMSHANIAASRDEVLDNGRQASHRDRRRRSGSGGGLRQEHLSSRLQGPARRHRVRAPRLSEEVEVGEGN